MSRLPPPRLPVSRLPPAALRSQGQVTTLQPQVKGLAIAGCSQTGRVHGLHGAEVMGVQRTCRTPCRQQERLAAGRDRMPGEDAGNRLKEQR